MAKQVYPQPKEVKAFARFIHMSPRKLRLVADLIRRARVDVALEQLRYSSKGASLPISKLINSAIANATHNFNLKREDLVVKSITVDGGPVMKRMVPRAQGRSEIIRRRMAHINVILESRPKTTQSKKARSIFTRSAAPSKDAKKVRDETAKDVEAIDEKNEKARPAARTDQVRKNTTNIPKRRLFNRKSGE